MPKTIVFQSDFTYKEGAVAAVWGGQTSRSRLGDHRLDP